MVRAFPYERTPVGDQGPTEGSSSARGLQFPESVRDGEALYPGIRSVVDGSEAVAWVETHVTQAACAYPITPSTNMGVLYAQAVADGARNLWGERLVFLEPESEHSSASAAEGFALAGGRVTNFTCGQGLILMKEVLYAISGKRLPMVFHVGARALTSQSLNIHAGHDDVMGVADTGWGILFSKNAQEAADLALVARRAAETCATPFLVVQDGFLTTHTLEVVRLPEPEFMRDFVGAPGERLRALFDPQRPLLSGPVQNQDSYMKGRIAQRFYTDRAAQAVEEAMEEFGAKTGRRYRRVETWKMDGARFAIVALGSMAETAMATVDWARRERGIPCGVVHPTCYRPFPARELVEALAGCDAFAVVERVDEPLAGSNPLARDIKAAFADALAGHPALPRIERVPAVFSGSAGLGGRDVRPSDFLAVLDRMASGGRREFVLGIRHPLALPREPEPDIAPAGRFRMRGHSIGGYGSVATNRTIAAILGEFFGLEVQAYPLYGSEKKGLPTTFYLTAAPERIRTHCELEHVEFVAILASGAFSTGNPLVGLAPGGTVFLQSSRTEPAEVWRELPPAARWAIRDRRLRVMYLDAAKIAADHATDPSLRVRMQGIVLLGVFLRAMPFGREARLSEEELFSRVEAALRRQFGARGERVVAQNLACARRGYREVAEIPRPVIYREFERERLALAGRRVADAMHRGVVTCFPDTPLGEVIASMVEHDVSAVVVVDRDGHLAGLLSVSDLRRANLSLHALEPPGPGFFPVDLMTREVETTHPDEHLETAAARLFERHIHRLVVTAGPGDRTPIGILSMTDLVRFRLPEGAEPPTAAPSEAAALPGGGT
jgi:pyruvate-ferredoxin/flavodoxin oxidoreductase